MRQISTTQISATRRTWCFSTIVGAWVALGVTLGGGAPAWAYEVWLTDQSDTGKESGGGQREQKSGEKSHGVRGFSAWLTFSRNHTGECRSR